MATPPNKPELEAAVAAYKSYRSTSEAARALQLSRSTFRHRLDMARRSGLDVSLPEIELAPKGRIEIPDFTDGVVIVGGDAHYWPGEPSTGHRAFVAFCQEYKPKIVVMNGDVCDFASVSRHPPIGWTKIPTAQEEIEVAIERMGEIALASRKAKRFWPLGNHDARLETFIAQKTPELAGVKGTSLSDHFPDWMPCWGVHIGGDSGLVVKHRFKGGLHASHNNALWAGCSIATNHLHSLRVSPISDYRGTRYGVDTGCLADPYAPAFQDYTEDNPKNWRSGFAMFTFRAGRLMWPELVHVIGNGRVEFRGEIIEV